MTPWLSFSENFAYNPASETGSSDVVLIQGNLTGADINKTLALGRLLDSDEGQGPVLLSNLEGLASIFHWLVEWGLAASLPLSWLGLCRWGVTACRVSGCGGRAFPGARGFFLQDLGGQETGSVCLRSR